MWEVSRPCDPDLRVRGNQVLLCFPYVGTSLQQSRGNSGGNFGRMRLLSKFQSARNIAGVIAQKDADRIFFFRDLLLEIRDLCRGRVHQLLGLADIQ